MTLLRPTDVYLSRDAIVLTIYQLCLDDPIDVATVAQAIADVCDSGKKKVLVNFIRVTSIASVARDAFARVVRGPAKVCFFGLAPDVKTVFVEPIDPVCPFRIAETVEEAHRMVA